MQTVTSRFDPHAGQIQGFFSIPGDVLTAFHMIIESHQARTCSRKMHDPVVVSVDLGFAKKGRNFAADIDAPIAFIEKRRVGQRCQGRGADHHRRRGGPRRDPGRRRGGYGRLHRPGRQPGQASRARATCTWSFVHPVLSRNAAERLAALPVKQYHHHRYRPHPGGQEEVHLEDRLTILSIAPLLGEVILRAHEGRSVGEMFNE